MNDRNGAFLKTLREVNHLSQMDVSKQLHVKRQTISNWELSKTVADLDILRCLASLYNFDFSKLLNVYLRDEEDPTLEEIHEIQRQIKELACGNAESCQISVKTKKAKKLFKERRKMHPLLKTALLSAGISFCVCIFVVIVFAIFLPLNAMYSGEIVDTKTTVVYAYDLRLLILIPIAIIFGTTMIATAIHAVIRLTKKKGENKK